MTRKLFELIWNAIGMSAVGAAVGFVVNGQYTEACGALMVGFIAFICWGIVD